jgi:hypothetical protein
MNEVRESFAAVVNEIVLKSENACQQMSHNSVEV